MDNTIHYPDVKGGYYYDPVRWASLNGIVSGYGDGRFGPNDRVTRQDFALILRNYARFKGYDVNDYDSLTGFEDSGSISGYARPALQWAVGAELLGGSGGRLMPKGTTNRAQMAVILKAFCQNIVGMD